MKRFFRMISALCMLLSVSACGNAQPDEDAIAVFPLSPSTEGVAAFLELLGMQDLEETRDTCYQVTPPDIRETYGFSIFKFDSSCVGYLLYEEQIYPLGEWFGGYGVTSFAVADLNHDNHDELYFTFSWGSGIHRSELGYFDTQGKNTKIFDEFFWNEDVMLTNENGSLSVYCAAVNMDSFVDMTLEAQEKIGEVTCSGNEIQFVYLERAES